MNYRVCADSSPGTLRGRLSSWCRRCLEARQSVRPPWFEGSCDFSGSRCTLRMLNQWTSGLLDVWICSWCKGVCVTRARAACWFAHNFKLYCVWLTASTAMVGERPNLFVCLFGSTKAACFLLMAAFAASPPPLQLFLWFAFIWHHSELLMIFFLTFVAKLDKQWNLKVLCKYVTMEFDAFSHNVAQLGADCLRETRVFLCSIFFLCLHLLQRMTNNVLLKCCANVMDNGIRSVLSWLGLFGCRIFKRDGGSHLHGFKTLDSRTLGFYSGPAFLTIYSGGCECNRLAGPYLWPALHRKFVFEPR